MRMHRRQSALLDVAATKTELLFINLNVRHNLRFQ